MANSFIGSANATIKSGGNKPTTTIVYGSSGNSKNTCNTGTGDFRKDVTEELRKQFKQ